MFFSLWCGLLLPATEDPDVELTGCWARWSRSKNGAMDKDEFLLTGKSGRPQAAIRKDLAIGPWFKGSMDWS